MSKRRRLNGRLLFVHKRSMTDTISVDRDGDSRDDQSDEMWGRQQHRDWVEDVICVRVERKMIFVPLHLQ